MRWKKILKGEEVHPSAEGYVKRGKGNVERQRPKDDKTLFQLDVMNSFRDFALKAMSLSFSGRTDMKNEKGEVKMPQTISVIQLLKKYGAGYSIGSKDISPAKFIEKERKLAEAIIDQIVDTLKVFPKLETTSEDLDRGEGYTSKFIRYAKSKLPRLSVSMATD